MIRPGLIVAGAVAVAVVLGALIPIQRAPPDFRKRQAAAPASAEALREIRWQELAPAGWDPDQSLRQLRQEVGKLSDADPQAADLLQRMRAAGSSAPANPALEGVEVRIPGYVVPIDESRRGLTEFLLVPYFGACIHSPPPPANQIIHVMLQRAVPGVRAMDPVWVNGRLRVQRSGSSMGTSGYAMSAVSVERYKQPGR